jgi:hypothetical protein
MPRLQKALPLVSLGQLFKFVAGKTPPREVAGYWDGKTPFANSRDLTEMELTHTRDRVTPRAVKNGTPVVKPGSILIAVRTQPGGISITQTRVAIGDDLKALEPRSRRVSARYVYWLLVCTQRESKGRAGQSPSRAVERFFSGARAADLQKLVFPLPGLRDQKRIADILKDADDACRARAKANQEMEELLPALFACMFKDEGFRPLRLDQCTDIISGVTPSRSTEEYWGGDIPWISSADITSKFLTDSKKHITKQALEKTGTRLAPPKSVVIGAGPVASPRHLRVGLTMEASAIGQDVKALICRRSVRPEYLLCALADVESELSRQATRLDVSELKGFTIQIPPLGRQKEWAGIVGDISDMTHVGNESLNELESLFDTLASLHFGRDVLRLDAARVRHKKRRKPREAPTVRAIEAELSDERPVIWPKLSEGQRRVWVLSRTFDKPFSVDELIAGYEKRRKSRLSREYVLGTLDLLVTLGAIIKEGRIDADRWRRPRPETDREAEV